MSPVPFAPFGEAPPRPRSAAERAERAERAEPPAPGPAGPEPAASGPSGAEPAQVAEVEQLRVTFRRGRRDIHALRGISLRLRAGEILGLVGESGSGKRVLGVSWLGLIPALPPPKVSGRMLVPRHAMLSRSAHMHRRDPRPPPQS